MSSPAPPVSPLYRWDGRALIPHDESAEAPIEAADSWLVSDGLVRGIGLHRERFDSVVREYSPGVELDAFWAAVIDIIPRQGAWFPRVELQGRGLAFRLRSAPALHRSLVLATHEGEDPRTRPAVKGPDLEAMRRVRMAAELRGADDAVILSPDGAVVEGSSSALLWWRGDSLCVPSADLARVDSVTARTLLTLARALRIDVIHESVKPEELDGLEVWAVNALHGIRVVTGWVDGPGMAEEPGRAELWRRRLHRLARPLGEFSEH